MNDSLSLGERVRVREHARSSARKVRDTLGREAHQQREAITIEVLRLARLGVDDAHALPVRVEERDARLALHLGIALVVRAAARDAQGAME